MTPKQFAHVLRSRRLQLGIKQCDLAETLGVSQVLLCQWEKAHVTPHIKKIDKWLAALSLELAFKETKPVAYSNWGAFAYKNGLRRTDREDVSAFQEIQPARAPQLFMDINVGSGNIPAHERTMHAVLGDGNVRLGIYQDQLILWVRQPTAIVQIDPAQFVTMEEDEQGQSHYRGMYLGLEFTAHRYRMEDSDGTQYPMVDVEVLDTDESRWTATCGYLYGAGHTDSKDGE